MANNEEEPDPIAEIVAEALGEGVEIVSATSAPFPWNRAFKALRTQLAELLDNTRTAHEAQMVYRTLTTYGNEAYATYESLTRLAKTGGTRKPRPKGMDW